MPLSHDHVGFLIADVSRMMRLEFQRRIEHSAITLAQSRTLVYISRHEGIRQVDLAQLLEIQPITLARLIDQLEAEGLVERRADPTDRRAYRIFQTPKADARLAAIEDVGASVREVALHGLSAEDREQLTAILTRMRENLAAK